MDSQLEAGFLRNSPIVNALSRHWENHVAAGRRLGGLMARLPSVRIAALDLALRSSLTMTEELNPKRLSLLKEAVPSVHRVGVLLRRDFPNTATADHDWRVAEAAALQLGVQLIGLDADFISKIKAAFEQTSASRVDGIMTFRNPTVVTYLRQVAELCQKYRLPAVFDSSEYAEAGGLLSYGPNIDATYAQLATYVVKLMHGAPPGQLPIEQPTKFEMVINQHVAAELGVTLPADLLASADRVNQ